MRHQHEVGPQFHLLPAALAELSGWLIQQRTVAQPGQWDAEQLEQLVLQVPGFCQWQGRSMQGFWPGLEEVAQGWQAPDAEVAAL